MKTYSAFSCKAKNALVVLFCLTMYHYSALAQRQVIGRVLDKETRQPIKAAKVTIHGTDSSTVTNLVGYFQIAADTTTYLLVTSPGYEPGLVKVPKADKFQLCLTKEETAETSENLENFNNFLKRNLRYPEPARRNKTEGRIYATFETDSMGEIQDITLLKDIGGTCGKEVLRVLKACPKRWVPLSPNARFILPVSFIIKGTLMESVEKEIDLPAGKLLNEIVVVAYFPQ